MTKKQELYISLPVARPMPLKTSQLRCDPSHSLKAAGPSLLRAEGGHGFQKAYGRHHCSVN